MSTSNINQQADRKKVRGVSDIVFCIDKSASMEHCIDGVIHNVKSFVAQLENLSGNTVVDWKLGVAIYSGTSIDFLNLTTNVNTVRDFISGITLEWNDEFTPGAIDYAATNTSWREKSHRVIVVFTDEPLLDGGTVSEPDKGAGKFNKFLLKLTQAKIQLLYFGPYCEYYNEFNMVPKAMVNTVENFDDIDFSELMKKLATTVTASSTNPQTGVPVPPLVYDLSSMTINKRQ